MVGLPGGRSRQYIPGNAARLQITAVDAKVRAKQIMTQKTGFY